ncbi:MAG TPA: CoA transferase [Rhizomicrobium sp.]|jgi:crotonobetainyl-CoA:carnitine CoA-transferase CaiB-like acyl-CoA transferase
MTVAAAYDSLNRITGLAPLRAPDFDGDDPIAPTPFLVGAGAAAALGLGASAANEIWRLRGGDQQSIRIGVHAAAASLVSFALLRLNGETVPRPSEGNPTVAFYRTGDGRWIHLHGGFPHLERRTLDLLNAQNTEESVGEAVAKWNAFALEEALAYLGLCGAVVRTAEEWRTSPQGAALAGIPPIVLRKIGEAPPLRLPLGGDPLAGIRVLDLTRVLAGPTVGRTLASYGAEVLNVRAEKLPTIPVFDLDTGHGKRSTFLDLAKPGDAETLRRLARDAHIFVESYRPGALSKLGFSPEALAHSAPGIVCVGVSCYGNRGPWAQRRGWEQLAQAATGLAVEQGAFSASRMGSRRESVPKLIPAAVCDYITGYLGASGAVAALLRRIREGGSWSVDVSLCATALWLQSLDRVDPRSVPESWKPGLDARLESCEMARGHLDFLGPVVEMSRTPPKWRRPPPEPGADPPSWPE